MYVFLAPLLLSLLRATQAQGSLKRESNKGAKEKATKAQKREQQRRSESNSLAPLLLSLLREPWACVALNRESNKGAIFFNTYILREKGRERENGREKEGLGC